MPAKASTGPRHTLRSFPRKPESSSDSALTPAFAGVSGRGGDRPAQNFLLGQWNVALDYLCKVYIPMTIPPRYRGAFDQRLQTRAGSGGRDMTLHRRCDARARRSKPRLSQRARPARRGPVMAGRPCSRHRSAASSALAWLRWDVTQRFRPHVAGTTTGEGAEQTSNTARGTP